MSINRNCQQYPKLWCDIHHTQISFRKMKVTLFCNRNMCDHLAASVQQDVNKLFQKILFILFCVTQSSNFDKWIYFSVKRERKNQQDAIIRCLLSTSVSTCFRHHYALLQENKGRVTAFGVLFWFCWLWLVAVVGALHFRMWTLLASYNAAPHNRYRPHPAEPAQYTICRNTAFVLLVMGIMMPETCWDRSW